MSEDRVSERLSALRARAARRVRDYEASPDTPEEAAEQAENMAFFWPLQLEAIARMDDPDYDG